MPFPPSQCLLIPSPLHSFISVFHFVFFPLPLFLTFHPSLPLHHRKHPSSCYCYYVERGNWAQVMHVCCMPHPCRPSSRTHPHPLTAVTNPKNTHTLCCFLCCLQTERKDREWTLRSHPLRKVLHVTLIISGLLSSLSLTPKKPQHDYKTGGKSDFNT